MHIQPVLHNCHFPHQLSPGHVQYDRCWTELGTHVPASADHISSSLCWDAKLAQVTQRRRGSMIDPTSHWGDKPTIITAGYHVVHRNICNPLPHSTVFPFGRKTRWTRKDPQLVHVGPIFLGM